MSPSNKLTFLLYLFLLAGGQVAHSQDWLTLNSIQDYVDIGDIDVPGDKLTVEAVIYQTQSSFADIVSKHITASTVNYLLRPYQAEITTSMGYTSTPVNCGLPFRHVELNQCIHVAMVYDGSNLVHYINGEVNGSIPWTGTLVQNDLTTKIGFMAAIAPASQIAKEQFYGHINEVRIWGVARTQLEIQTYMADTLPNPATQTLLLGYYRFNSLKNLQGKADYDGVLNGGAQIQFQNTFCPGLDNVCGGTLPIEFPQQKNLPEIYAFQNKCFINLASSNKKDLSISVMNMKGAVIHQNQEQLFAGESLERIIIIETPGIYFVGVEVNGKKHLKKIRIL